MANINNNHNSNCSNNNDSNDNNIHDNNYCNNMNTVIAIGAMLIAIAIITMIFHAHTLLKSSWYWLIAVKIRS